MLWDTGLRLGELVRTKLDDVDYESDPVSIVIPRTKTNRSRTVFLGVRRARALLAYLRMRELFFDAESDALWLGKKGALTEAGVKLLLQRRGETAGIYVSPHMFRRGSRVHAGLEGMDPTAIMTIAAWKPTAMLDRYVRPGAEALAKAEFQRVRKPRR